MTCPGCSADPHPRDSQPRRCAFGPDGDFIPSNWACVTMLALRSYAEKRKTVHRSTDDQSIGVLPTGDLDPEGDLAIQGWLVMCWYKHRGATGQACILDEDGMNEPLDLARATAILAELDGEIR